MMDAVSTEWIVSALSPEQPIQKNPLGAISRKEVPLFSNDEIVKAIKAMKNGKALEPDGIPVEKLQRAIKVIIGILFNAYLVAEVFTTQ